MLWTHVVDLWHEVRPPFTDHSLLFKPLRRSDSSPSTCQRESLTTGS